MMNILVIGSGGREHALSWKLSQSNLCEQLFIAPGNAGTEGVGKNIPLNPDDFASVATFIKKNNVNLVVVGPEAPLVNGIRDFLENDSELKGLMIIGPGKSGARLEGSKDFSKEFMVRHGIPTGKAMTFHKENIEEGIVHLKTLKAPYVLKADGLAAGKGVIITESFEEARSIFKDMIQNKMFGEASTKVLLEEYLDGVELSVFVLTDGESYKILPEAKDYKRIGENDTGPNTGGMGAVSPVPFADKILMEKIEKRVVIPTIKGLKSDGIPYIGFIFIGLMIVNGNPYVIEYNVRMGDPESQVVIPRLNCDLAELFQATSRHTLNDFQVNFDKRAATTVVMVAEGYPGPYNKGKSIEGLDLESNWLTFHAGTEKKDGQIVTNGGRILAITGMGESMQTALSRSYQGVSMISWEGEYHRNDIGQDILAMS
ncbi:MAG TPA: phosphoribosylamine--glycine ligase [Cyclobacteriaceae bacterium]